jgi:hypothetical protein
MKRRLKMKQAIKELIRKLFYKKYSWWGMVQYDEHNQLTVCGNKVRWLEEVEVEEMSYEKAVTEAFKILKSKYPEYGDNILLW